MNRVPKPVAIAIGALVAVFVVTAIAVPHSFPNLTPFYVSIGSLVGLFLIAGVWLLSARKLPHWLTERSQYQVPGSIPLTGLMLILLAVEFAIAMANSLLGWHALWPLYATTLITLVALAIATILAVRSRSRRRGPTEL
jgi:hypothetical protein